MSIQPCVDRYRSIAPIGQPTRFVILTEFKKMTATKRKRIDPSLCVSVLEVPSSIKGLGFHASSISRYTVIESYATGRCYDPHTNKSLREFPNMASAGTANGRQGAARGGGPALHLRVKI